MTGWGGLRASHEFTDEAERVLAVGPQFYRLWVKAVIRCPWERVRLLYNAGFRGSDLR
jgi:hypothetical protein